MSTVPTVHASLAHAFVFPLITHVEVASSHNHEKCRSNCRAGDFREVVVSKVGGQGWLQLWEMRGRIGGYVDPDLRPSTRCDAVR